MHDTHRHTCAYTHTEPPWTTLSEQPAMRAGTPTARAAAASKIPVPVQDEPICTVYPVRTSGTDADRRHRERD